MAALETNLALAKQAVAYVKTIMTVGAANDPRDYFHSFESTWLCVLAHRTTTDDYITEKAPVQVRLLAAQGETTGCGNCGVQSALAFVWLKDRGVRPLDWMERSNPQHLFVVIGRKEGSDPADPTTWEETTVICDPWAGEAFVKSIMASRLHGGSLRNGVIFSRLRSQ